MTAPRALHLPARGLVKLRDGSHMQEIPVSQLGAWIAFYKRLRDRKGGRYAHHYAPTVGVLEDIQKEVQRAREEVPA